ncbi:transcription termination factor NusA [Candidatus Uhrbacteria bacterium RIFCSPHIGHO2_02_FULL_53_13]|uniref:Transcription termination/antitermination protein NusA n=3 Tax=Candidatus Uhriibacteriota TaxID=1752732 RepID=A0A1F7TVJ8_9BACT|nr:MAG: transcription termination factor NusA [Candidatus Uhrbacteria bacterium RIFCSPHIGHO2_02_FULL_53_13]
MMVSARAEIFSKLFITSRDSNNLIPQPMSSPIEQAIRQIVEEKGLSYESVMETIEAALAAAFRKDFGNRLQNIEAKFNPADASLQLWDVKTVVEDQELPEKVEEEEFDEFKRPPKPVEESEEDLDEGPRFNPKMELMLTDAKALKADAEIGDVLRTELDIPSEFGRMAAMTAKQVITQKLREAEREVTYNEYKEHEGDVLMGTVQRRQGRVILVELGRGTAIMRPDDQVPGERYYPGDRIRVYIMSVDLGMRGPEILVSRTAPELVLELFKTEIPEIADGTVRIEAIAREPGSRSKVAVACDDNGIDPIGACIGQRGARIQTIIGELGGEKVDIIEFDADAGLFVMNALAPAKVESVELDEESKVATVTVESDQLSLAIGKGGQNVRLAARLTDWRINVAEKGGAIKGSSEGAVEVGSKPTEAVVEAEVEEEVEEAQAADVAEDVVEAAEGDVDDGLEDEETADEESAMDAVEDDALPTSAMDEADAEAAAIEPEEETE